MNSARVVSASILQISNDLALAESRCLLLRSAGWQTETRTSQTYEERDLGSYDLLLFCQSIPVGTVRDTARLLLARNLSRPAMVRIAWSSEATYDARYRTLLAPAAPAELIEAIRNSLVETEPCSATVARQIPALAQARALNTERIEPPCVGLRSPIFR